MAKFDINATADLEDIEFKEIMGGQIPATDQALMAAWFKTATDAMSRMLQSTTLPIDWAGSGYVFSVKSQGICGSCWAFASVGVLEAMISIKKSATAGSLITPVRLSEQQLVDCTLVTPSNYALFGKTYSNFGCKGGCISNGWNFSREQGNMLNADYPYKSTSLDICLHDSKKQLLELA